MFALSVQAFAQVEAAADRYETIAIYHAPLVTQYLGTRPGSDVFTRFNFDGDWNGDNNWENYKLASDPSVYYDVIETETHYFITYNFFYPRDYLPICVPGFCHENDLEGIRLTVQKDGTPYGTLWMVEMQAHGALKVERNPKTRELDLDDGFEPHEHATLWSEPGKHGFHSGAVFSFPLISNMYVYGAPGSKKSHYRHYALAPLEELWDHRDEVGAGCAFSSTFVYAGKRFNLGTIPKSFTGQEWTPGAADPVWAWQMQTDIARGDWFFDPAYAFCARGDCPEGFSQTYLHHRFLGINP